MPLRLHWRFLAVEFRLVVRHALETTNPAVLCSIPTSRKETDAQDLAVHQIARRVTCTDKAAVNIASCGVKSS